MGFCDFDRDTLDRKIKNPGDGWCAPWPKMAPPEKPSWAFDCRQAYAMAACKNAVLLTTETELIALDPAGGQVRWKRSLPDRPVPWGLAVDPDGRAIVTLADCRVLCFGRSGTSPQVAMSSF